MQTVPIPVVVTSLKLAEADWLRFIFAEPVFSLKFIDHVPQEAMPGHIYCISTYFDPFDTAPASFARSARQAGNVGLFHLSDEWFRADYNYYANFAFVLRMIYTSALDRPGILTLPLGLPNGSSHRDTTVPASQRKFVWSYCGTQMSSRPDMLRALSGLAPSFVLADGLRLPKIEFNELLCNSKFTPAPMGNVIIESWRFYEALEAGSIPIVERRASLDYYRALLGVHPIPTFSSWQNARDFMETMLTKPDELDDLQNQVSTWWRTAKIDWQRRAASFAAEGLRGEYCEALQNFSFAKGMYCRAWRYLELSRHHSASALLRRARLMAARIARGHYS